MNQINAHHAKVDTVAEHEEWQQRQTRRFAFGPLDALDRFGNNAMEVMTGGEPDYGDEVLDSQAPSPCDPAAAMPNQGYRTAAIFIVGGVALLSAAAWIGWLAV